VPDGDVPRPERSPELETLEADLARRHWEAWIDTKVPALGNRTPRQAAKTARGLERLNALLADFARMAEGQPSANRPDLESLRRRLGLR
jgi:plasmid stabilization system protein ParE